MDITADCAELDGGEPVSVTFRRSNGTNTIAVPSALRRALSRGLSAGSGISLSGDELTWNIPQSALGADGDVRPGDTITAGIEIWTILAVRHETLGSRWRCICRRQP